MLEEFNTLTENIDYLSSSNSYNYLEIDNLNKYSKALYSDNDMVSVGLFIRNGYYIKALELINNTKRNISK